MPPLASYQPAVQSGVYVYTAGQLPMVDGQASVTGKVGAEVTAEQAKELARTCALNALAAVKSVAGDLDRVARVVKVVGFVASAADFTGQPGVVNGASELLRRGSRREGRARPVRRGCGRSAAGRAC